jgi:hypothetical protein
MKTASLARRFFWSFFFLVILFLASFYAPYLNETLRTLRTQVIRAAKGR